LALRIIQPVTLPERANGGKVGAADIDGRQRSNRYAKSRCLSAAGQARSYGAMRACQPQIGAPY